MRRLVQPFDGADCSNSCTVYTCRGGSRKIFLGAWPLIIWKATTAKRNCYRTNYILKEIWGAWARFGGPVPPGPNIEPPLSTCPATVVHWPTPLTIPNGIRIQSAVLPCYTFQTDRLTHGIGNGSFPRALTLYYIDSEQHIKNNTSQSNYLCQLSCLFTVHDLLFFVPHGTGARWRLLL